MNNTYSSTWEAADGYDFKWYFDHNNFSIATQLLGFINFSSAVFIVSISPTHPVHLSTS